MVELLLDRGADLEAKGWVSAAAVRVAAPRAVPGVTGISGRGDGDRTSGQNAPVAGRRVRRP